MAASSSASAAARRVSAGVIGRDELDGEDVLARPAVAAMAAVPGARAAPAVRRRANAVLDPAGRRPPRPPMAGAVGRLDPNGARLDEPARVAEARLETLDAPEVERQLAAEEPAVGQVVADDPRQRQRRKRARDLVARPPGRGRQRVDPEPRLPAERATDRSDRAGGRGVGQAMEGATLAGEAAPDLGAQDERQSSARDVELPAGAAVAGRGEDAQRRRMAGDPVEQAEAGQTGQADGAVTRIVVERAQATARRRDPDRPLRGRLRDRPQEGARARRVELGRRRQLGLDRLDLEEPAQPARRQRDPPLDAPTRRPPRPPRRPPRPTARAGSAPGRRRAPCASRARSRRWSSPARASRPRTPRAAGRPARRRCSTPRTPRTAGGRRRTSRRDRPARGSA